MKRFILMLLVALVMSTSATLFGMTANDAQTKQADIVAMQDMDFVTVYTVQIEVEISVDYDVGLQMGVIAPANVSLFKTNLVIQEGKSANDISIHAKNGKTKPILTDNLRFLISGENWKSPLW